MARKFILKQPGGKTGFAFITNSDNGQVSTRIPDFLFNLHNVAGVKHE